jgi:hypothetical protein
MPTVWVSRDNSGTWWDRNIYISESKPDEIVGSDGSCFIHKKQRRVGMLGDDFMHLFGVPALPGGTCRELIVDAKWKDGEP